MVYRFKRCTRCVKDYRQVPRRNQWFWHPVQTLCTSHKPAYKRVSTHSVIVNLHMTRRNHREINLNGRKALPLSRCSCKEHNTSAHPSYSHYYLLSPSTLFFFFCTSYCFLHILLFFAHLFCTSYCLLHILLFFAHLIVLHFFYFIAHFTLISPFLTICMPLCYVTLYNLYSYYFALSTERTWFDYISLLIIPCITIMWQIKKPWTLEPWTSATEQRKGTMSLWAHHSSTTFNFLS